MKSLKRHAVAVLATASLLGARVAVAEAVTVRIGPTNIPGGTARGARDITLANARLAVAFAVETAPPWGVARGGIVDVAEVRDGVVAHDHAALVDFMPDDWSGWPTTYQRVEILEQSPERAVLRVERDWESVQLETTWTLEAGADRLHVLSRMHNTGKRRYPALLSGYVIWPEGGHLFGVPGFSGGAEGALPPDASRWSAAYNRDWFMGLHAPFAEWVNDDARDMYRRHALAPGETREFEAWLQVGPRGDLAAMVEAETALRGLASGEISGRVSGADGAPLRDAAVIVDKDTGGRVFPYVWASAPDGQYRLRLPAGRYRLRATAEGRAETVPVGLAVVAGQSQQQDFSGLAPPGSVHVSVRATGSGAPLDARIAVESGASPLIGYFGKPTFFTELSPRGEARLRLPPGDYRLRVSAAEGFRARATFLNLRVQAGGEQSLVAEIDQIADPAAEGWWSGDMHHHSDVLDGFTPPAEVLRSELAAGLDIAFLSDHDATRNNREMDRLAALRGLPFIAGTELSPSWAHFNAYPLDANAEIGIDVGNSTVQAIFAEAKRMGAKLLQVNHPYINYGYFRSQREGAIPGGYSSDFDLVEVNGGEENDETVRHAWRLWNGGQRAYLSAGSDAHDVLTEPSGTARMVVRLEGPLGVDAFVAALKRGASYATQGPLLFPQQRPGSEIRLAAGASLALGIEVQAVNGLASVQLVERGEIREHRKMDGSDQRSKVHFTVRPRADTWYAWVVEDRAGRRAWSNPVWVSVAKGG